MHIRSLITTAFHRRIISSDDVLFWGILVLISSLIAVILFDGSIFYQTFFRPSAAQPTSKTQTLTAADIDAVITILDERQKRFNTLLAPQKK